MVRTRWPQPGRRRIRSTPREERRGVAVPSAAGRRRWRSTPAHRDWSPLLWIPTRCSMTLGSTNTTAPSSLGIEQEDDRCQGSAEATVRDQPDQVSTISPELCQRSGDAGTSSITRSTTKSCGDERTRTADPLLAKQVLYQLSYVPASKESTSPSVSARHSTVTATTAVTASARPSATAWATSRGATAPRSRGWEPCPGRSGGTPRQRTC